MLLKEKIYGLYGSHDGVLRYVGHTSESLDKRLEQHFNMKRNSQLAAWIKAVHEAGYDVRIEKLLGNLSNLEARTSQRLFVKEYSRKQYIFNLGPSDQKEKLEAVMSITSQQSRYERLRFEDLPY